MSTSRHSAVIVRKPRKLRKVRIGLPLNEAAGAIYLVVVGLIIVGGLLIWGGVETLS